MSRRALCELMSESHGLLLRLAAKVCVRLHMCAFGTRRQITEIVQGGASHPCLFVFCEDFYGFSLRKVVEMSVKILGGGPTTFPSCNNLSVHEGQHCFSVVVRCWPSGLPVCASVC